ncbi:hypothetical protein [Pedobacter sp. UC225_65]|uniref:hypothetical protein n=1 Tax=Pedobacter sp. UC225_65 TaxID=3350173 RepID=UPI00366C5E26
MQKRQKKRKLSASKQLRSLKQRRRFNDFTKNQNRYIRRRSKRYTRDRSGNSSLYNTQNKRIRIHLPSEFSIDNNVEGVLEIIYRTKKLLENANIRYFDFDFSKVTDLDDGAATILLSLCHDIAKLKRSVSVNKPSDPDARKFFEHIGFRQFFQGYVQNKDNLNTTLKKGKTTILQKDTVPIIHKAMKTVFGVDKKNQRLQGMLIELMTNSVNHAYLNQSKKKREKSWYISTRHDTVNAKVEFCFVDNGDGIINTIHVRLGKRLLLSPEEILERAFEGEFRSRTKQKNRGRGLIVIKKNFDKFTVTGLKVITNNVVLDFETGTTTKLRTPFMGTFYSWILDKNCTS